MSRLSTYRKKAAVGLPGRMPGTKPPWVLMPSESSSGLNVTVLTLLPGAALMGLPTDRPVVASHNCTIPLVLAVASSLPWGLNATLRTSPANQPR